MNEQSMTQFATEGQPAFPVVDTENDNSAPSSGGEETTTEQTPSSEGEQTGTETPAEGEQAGGEGGEDRGLADHPRWKERENDWTTRFNDQETRHADEIKKVTESVQTQVQTAVAEALKQSGVDSNNEENATPQDIPSWFGGDEQQWQEFRKWNDGNLSAAEERGAQKAQQEITQKSEAEQKAIDDATKYMNTEVAALESDKELNPDGVKIDRNKLLKFILDNELVDTQGRWNYKAGFRLMQAQEASKGTQKTQDRKKLAGATTTEKGSETTPPPFATPDTFSNPQERPW